MTLPACERSAIVLVTMLQKADFFLECCNKEYKIPSWDSFSLSGFPLCATTLSKSKLRARASLVAQTVKNSPANARDVDLILGLEDRLEKKIATPSVLLPGKFHAQRSLAGYSLWVHKRVGHD